MKRVLCKSLGILLTVIMMACFIPATMVLAAEEGEPTYTADEVIAMMEELPESPEEVTKDDVELIFEIYDALYYFYDNDYTSYLEVAEAFGYDEENIGDFTDYFFSYYWEALIIVWDLYDSFEEAVEDIPDLDELTLDDESTVIAAREAFDNLFDFQQEYYMDEESDDYDYYVALLDAEEKIEELKEVAEVIDMIEALPAPEDVTIDNSDVIDDALYAYNILTDTQKELVGEEYYEKLLACETAEARVWLEEYMNDANYLLEHYSDMMTAEQIEAINTTLAAAEEILADKTATVEDIWDAADDLYEAMWDANLEIWVNFTIVEGENSVWLTDSTTGITIRIKQEGLIDYAYELFCYAGEEILIDGEAVEGGINTSKGSLVIEIMPDLLKTLSVGEHKLTVTFANGVTKDIAFTIKAPSDVPASGELVSPAAYVGVAMVVLAAAGFVVTKRMAKKES